MSYGYLSFNANRSYANAVSGPKTGYADTLKSSTNNSPRQTTNLAGSPVIPLLSPRKKPVVPLEPEERKILNFHDEEVRRYTRKINEILHNVYTPYNTRVEEVWKIIDQMKDEQLRPTIHTYVPILDIHATMQNEGEFNKVLEFMKEEQIELNEHAITTWIKLYRKKRDIKNAKYVFYIKSKEHRITPTTALYNSLLDLYGKLGKTEELEKLLGEMQKAQVQPNITTYTCRLYAYSRASNEDKVKKIWREMLAKKIIPNGPAYTCVLALHVRKKDQSKAQEIFEIIQKQVDLSLEILNTMLYLYTTQCLNKEKANEIMNEFNENLKPNIKTFTIWLKLFDKSMKTADDIIAELESSTGLKAKTDFLNALLMFFLRNDQEEEADKLYQRIREEQRFVMQRVLSDFVDLKVAKGKFEEATHFYEQLKIDEILEKPEEGRKVIDLHNISHGTAYLKLRRFINSDQMGTQPFKVLTGKGLHSYKGLFGMKNYIQMHLKKHHPNLKIILPTQNSGYIFVYPPISHSSPKRKSEITREHPAITSEQPDNKRHQRIPKIEHRTTKSKRKIQKPFSLLKKEVAVTQNSKIKVAFAFISLIFLHFACNHYFSGIGKTV